MTLVERLAKVEARIEALAKKLDALEVEIKRLAEDIRELAQHRAAQDAAAAAKLQMARIGERIVAIAIAILIGAASLAAWVGERWSVIRNLFGPNGK